MCCSGAAGVIAAGNQRLDAIPATADVSFLDRGGKDPVRGPGRRRRAPWERSRAARQLSPVLSPTTPARHWRRRVAAATEGNVVPPILVVSDATVAETDAGQTTCEFTVQLLNPSVSAVSVDYRTIDQSAKVGDGDYLATSGTLTWDRGRHHAEDHPGPSPG